MQINDKSKRFATHCKAARLSTLSPSPHTQRDLEATACRPAGNRQGNCGDSGVAQSHETAFQLVEEGDGQGCPRCRGIISYCLSKSVPVLHQRCILRLRAVVLPPTANTASVHWAAFFSDMRRTTREVLLSCSFLQRRGSTPHSSNCCYKFNYGTAIK